MREQQLRRIVREEIQRLDESVAGEISDFLSRSGDRLMNGEFFYDGFRFVVDRMGDLTTFITIKEKNGGPELGHAKVEDGMIYITTADTRMASNTAPVGEYAGARNLINALVERFEHLAGGY